MKSLFTPTHLRIEDFTEALVDALEAQGFNETDRYAGMVNLDYPLYTSATEAKEIYRKVQKDLDLIK